MADGYDYDHESIVLNCRNDPIVADAVAPKTLPVAGEGMAEPARIIAVDNTFAQKAQYARFRLDTQLAKLARRGAVEFDTPSWRSHQSFVRFLRSRSSVSRLTRGPPRASRRRAR